MRVSPLAQRELNNARVNKIVADFDPEQIGNPTVNLREGWYYIVDGQHRIEACRRIGWEDQSVQCQQYEGLTEREEAEMFLKLGDVLNVDSFSKFRIGVQAGREAVCDIDRIVRANGLCVSRSDLPGAIRCVGTLQRLYSRAGGVILGRTLRIIRDAFGDAGLESVVIDGVGLVCQRYGTTLVEADVIGKLTVVNGGVNGVLGRANILRLQTGCAMGHAVAASVVEFVNRGGRGHKNKLEPWFEAEK
jgi:hypothetical protein